MTAETADNGGTVHRMTSEPERLDFLGDLEDMTPAPGSRLPVSVVRRQRALAERSDHELMRLIAEAAIALASRQNTMTPAMILTSAAGKVSFKDWERVKADVRRAAASEAA